MALAASLTGLLGVVVVDGNIAEQEGTLSETDTAPILHSTTDGITFSSGLTDVNSVWTVGIVNVLNRTATTQATIQGDVHRFSDWYYGKQGAAARYSAFTVVGVFDPAASGYSVPTLFTKSSQGTLTVRSYLASAPVNGGTDTTYYWAYDATANRYVIGTSKNLASETRIAPITVLLGTTYVKTLDTNHYVIQSVASAGNKYVPTLTHGKHLPLVSLPASHTWYVLMDPPKGVHEDTYTYVLRATAKAV